MSSRWIRSALAALVAAAPLGLAGCGKEKAEAPSGPINRPPGGRKALIGPTKAKKLKPAVGDDVQAK